MAAEATLRAYAGIGLNASDIEVSRKFYREGLGLKEFLVLPPQPGSDVPVEVVFTRSGQYDEGAILSLADRTEIGKLYPALVAGRGRAAFGRLTSATADGPAMRAKLSAAGYEPVSFHNAGEFDQGDTFGLAFVIDDPDGYTIEIFTGEVSNLVPGLVRPTTNPAAPMIDRFVGLAVRVSDIDRSARFYTEVLGMAEHRRIPGATAEAPPRKVVLTKSGELAGGVLVLLSDDGVGDARTEFGRILCQTADPDGAVDRLAAAGYDPTPPAGSPAGKLRFVTDPDGFVVELFRDFTDS